jgi:hypothetical protein
LIHRLGILLAFCNNSITDRCFLQPLLPEEYQISPACETVLLLSTQIKQKLHLHSEQVLHTDHHSLHLDQPQADSHSEQHHHDLNHQCPFCFFYGHLVAPPTLGIKEVFVRVQVRYLHLYQVFIGFFFSLQRLFLIPQVEPRPLRSQCIHLFNQLLRM